MAVIIHSVLFLRQYWARSLLLCPRYIAVSAVDGFSATAAVPAVY